MSILKDLLARLHYLNHSYLSGLCTLITLALGFLVLSKNRKSELYRVFFWMMLAISTWFLGNALSMFYVNKFGLAFFYLRFGYTGAILISVSYYHFYLTYSNKKKIILYFLYAICILEIIYLWLLDDWKIGSYVLPNVGVVWQGMPRFSYFLIFGMLKYAVISTVTAFSFLGQYKNETVALKRQQLKYLTITFFMAIIGIIEWLVAFDIPLHIGWITIPFFVAPLAYAIIRYRLMDIQVVFSRTFAIVMLGISVLALHLITTKFLYPLMGYYSAGAISLAFIGYIILGTPLSKKLFSWANSIVLKDKYNYQEILKEASHAVITILDLEELLIYLIDVIRKSLNVGRLAILMKNDTGEGYTLRWASGIDQGLLDRYTLKNGLIEWIKEKKEVFVKEEQEMVIPSDKFLILCQDIEKIYAEIVVPLFYKGRLEGVLALDQKANREPYMQSDIDLLSALASQAVIAIKNAQLYEEAITDSLTGLYHHKYFKLRINEEMERARRYQRPLSLLMLDLDHFKEINDCYGHQTGDAVLKRIADILRTKTRKVDIVARYGGEEFAIILPETGTQGAQVVAGRLNQECQEARCLAERIRKSVEVEEFRADEDKPIKLTVSIGIGYCDAKDKECSSSELLRRADTALYRAKENGRNRTEVWE